MGGMIVFKHFFIGTLMSITISGLGACAMAQEATVETLMQADRDFSQMAQEGEVRDAFLAYMTNDAVMLNGGQQIIHGEGAVAASVGGWPDGLNLSWDPVSGMIAESQDLGFTYGTYRAWGEDDEGNAIESHGKYVTIWHVQEDGSWKWVLDGGNPSPGPEDAD